MRYYLELRIISRGKDSSILKKDKSNRGFKVWKLNYSGIRACCYLRIGEYNYLEVKYSSIQVFSHSGIQVLNYLDVQTVGKVQAFEYSSMVQVFKC